MIAHLQQAFAILRTPRADDLETGDLTVPGRVVLRVLGRNTGRRTVRSTEDDGHGDVTTGHVERLAGRVDDLVDGLHRKVERHEFATVCFVNKICMASCARALDEDQQVPRRLQDQRNPSR